MEISPQAAWQVVTHAQQPAARSCSGDDRARYPGRYGDKPLTLDELRELALASQKFREWRPSQQRKSLTDFTGDAFVELGGSWHSGPEPKPSGSRLFEERHYSPAELASTWGLSVDLIRRMFEPEPGVLKHGDPKPRKGRKYVTLRIPESVAIRVHNRLSAVPAPVKITSR